jgi:uncharacterized damage-inducible protein DinB
MPILTASTRPAYRVAGRQGTGVQHEKRPRRPAHLHNRAPLRYPAEEEIAVVDRKRQLQDEIAAARGEVLGLVSRLSPEQFDRPTANAGWSVKDTLAHLSSIEARLRSMWQHALDGQAWPAEDRSVDAYNDRCVAERRSWTPEAIVAELEQTGRETDGFLDRLAADDLDRRWDHPVRGTVTIQALAEIVPRHLRAHREELQAALGG